MWDPSKSPEDDSEPQPSGSGSHDERGRGRGRSRGRGQRRGRGRGRGGRGRDAGEEPNLELVQVRAEKALTKRRIGKLTTDQKGELLTRKRQAELQRVLLPDAPPRKRKARKPSPEREACPEPLAAGDPQPQSAAAAGEPQPQSAAAAAGDPQPQSAAAAEEPQLQSAAAAGEPQPQSAAAAAGDPQPQSAAAAGEPQPQSAAAAAGDPQPQSAAAAGEPQPQSAAAAAGEPQQPEHLQPFGAAAEELLALNIEDMDVLILDGEVEVESVPSQARVSIGVNDDQFDATINDWMVAGDDSDLDIDLDDDACPLPATRNAASEPACNTDMTELAVQILQVEDELNDRALRDIVSNDDCYHFDWKKDQTHFTGRRETFTGTSGPTFDMTDKTVIDVFYEMFDSHFIDLLCTETNRYAEQKIALLKAEYKLLPKSRLNRWTPTDRDEMITFLAILILQGLYNMPEEEKYFHFNGFGTMPYFSRIMTYNRFVLLKSMYHFVDNETLTDKTKLCKIQPVLDYLNDKFSSLYMPSQEIAIDESLLKWHGRLSFAQKIATKAAKVGIKTYELCESRSGYLWKFFVYEGKKTQTTTNDVATVDRPDDDITDRPDDETTDRPDDESTDRPDDETPDRPCDKTDDRLDSSVVRPFNATAKIVYDLVEPLLNRGHTIIMDNYYNSPLLLRCLKTQQTDCYGTLRLNREFVPDSIKTLTKTDLRQGEVCATYSPDLSLMVWRDANLVSMISTYHQLQIGTQNKYNRLTYKPKIVLDYNKSMGGVDRKDQFLSAQPMEGLRNRVWYKKVFCRLLSMAIFNAYIIFSTVNKNISHRQFRTTLAEDLLKIYRRIDLTTEPRLWTTSTGQMIKRTSTLSRPKLVHNHFPARSGKKKGRCWICSQSKRDVRTIWKCLECNINLCIDNCFREYHI